MHAKVKNCVPQPGDHPDAVRAVAAELRADEVKAGLLPHEKDEAVRILAERSRGVAMVGDGVNDAPAMAAATLGIAMGAAGTDVAIETGDVVRMSDEVEKVNCVIHLGRRARRVWNSDRARTALAPRIAWTPPRPAIP